MAQNQLAEYRRMMAEKNKNTKDNGQESDEGSSNHEENKDAYNVSQSSKVY